MGALLLRCIRPITVIHFKMGVISRMLGTIAITHKIALHPTRREGPFLHHITSREDVQKVCPFWQ